MDTPVAYAEKLRPRHHAKKNPLLGTLAINQKINPKGLTLIRRAGKWGGVRLAYYRAEYVIIRCPASLKMVYHIRTVSHLMRVVINTDSRRASFASIGLRSPSPSSVFKPWAAAKSHKRSLLIA